jgi:hypothetical protein
MTNTQCPCRCHWGYKDYPDKLADSIKQCEHCSPPPDAIGTDTVSSTGYASVRGPTDEELLKIPQIQSLLTKEKTQLLERVEREVVKLEADCPDEWDEWKDGFADCINQVCEALAQIKKEEIV